MAYEGLRRWLGDIRFWIILLFLLRLFAITNPPLEVAHNWRQTTVTMVARNFLETDNDILLPRIDIAGDKTGITGMEFPFLNYLIYLCSLVFGYSHWYGRLINLIVSSIGLWFFYRLVRKYFTEPFAFRATFILILSVWFTYSRKIMPDTFSMSLLIIGFYYGSNFLDREKTWKNLALYAGFVLLGVLSKLPAGYVLILFLLFLFNRETNPRAKITFAIVSLLMLTVISTYYFYWVPYLTNHYGFSHFFMGKNVSEGITETFGHLDEALEKFYEEALGYSGFLIFLAGLTLMIYKKEKRLLFILGLASAGFLAIILKSGFAFYHHTYYIIPFAPIMALVAAFALEQISSKKAIVIILCLFSIEAILSKNHDFYIKEENMAMMQLEECLDKLGDKTDLILINSDNVPTPMYFAHRKGWVDYNQYLVNADYVNTLKRDGLKFIVILKRVFGKDIILNYEQVLDTEDFRIYKL